MSNKLVPRGAGDVRLLRNPWKDVEARVFAETYESLKFAPVTKPPELVTKLADVTKPKGGRPARFGKAMSPAERKRLSRAASKS